ncbi:MAG: FixH family protein [bacterium]
MSRSNQQERPSWWGWGIASLTVGFVLFLGVLVIVAGLQSYDLVEDDCYAKAVAFQGRLDQLNRTDSLGVKPIATYEASSGALSVVYEGPLDIADGPGSIRLYRPSNAQSDRVFDLRPDPSGRQVLQVGAMLPGLWRVQFEWRAGGLDFYSEQTLVVGE